MSKQNCIIIVLLLLCFNYSEAQKADTTFVWADRLLTDEAPFQVINSLGTKPSSFKDIYGVNRVIDATLLNLDHRNAFLLLQHADSLAENAPARERAYLLTNWARYHFMKANFKSALASANEATVLVEHSLNNSFGYQVFLLSKFQSARALLQLQKMSESRKMMDDVYVGLSADSSHFAIKRGQACFALGLWCKLNGRLDEAVQWYHSAIRLFSASRYQRYTDLAKCFNNLGAVYKEHGNYIMAKTNYLKSIDLKKRFGSDSLALAISFSNLAGFFQDYGNSYEAMENFKRAIALLNPDEPGNQPARSKILNNYGACLYENDEFTAAETIFTESLRTASGESAKIPPLINIGNILILKNELTEAERQLNAAGLKLADSLSAAAVLSQWYESMGNLNVAKRQAKAAKENFSRALRLAEPGNLLYQSRLYAEQSALELLIRDFPAAIENARKSRTLIAKAISKEDHSASTVLNLQGDGWLQLGNLDSANHYLQEAMKVNIVRTSSQQRAVNPIELVATLYLLCELEFQHYAITRNDATLQSAWTYAELALKAIDDHRRSLSVTNDQLIFDGRIYEMFERAMNVLYALPASRHERTMEDVFWSSELSKAQSLGQAMRGSKLQSFANVTAAMQEKDGRLRDELRQYDMQLLKETTLGDDANPDLLLEYEKHTNAATELMTRFQDSVRTSLPGYYQLKYNKTLVKLNELREMLKVNPDAVVLDFTAGDSAIYCQAISLTGSLFYKINNAPRIRSMVIAFRNQIKAGLQNELYANAADLYNCLIKPSEPMIHGKNPARQLIIIPDQFLCYLPFEALISKEKTRRFLISDFDISYSYSATLLWQKFKEEPQHASTGKFFGMAPAFNGSPSVENGRDVMLTDRFRFTPLSGNLAEVETIGHQLSRRHVEAVTLQGQGATEETFRKMNLSDFNYVHLATHGFVDMDEPRYSGVAFAQEGNNAKFDGLLLTGEVYQLQLNARLVSLSSCESGIGKLFRGEGMTGLSQAFLYVGARNLAVSLWKVDDTATRDLMINFYSGIHRKSLAGALSSAKRKMLSEKKYNHPQYWAPFVLIGL